MRVLRHFILKSFWTHFWGKPHDLYLRSSAGPLRALTEIAFPSKPMRATPRCDLGHAISHPFSDGVASSRRLFERCHISHPGSLLQYQPVGIFGFSSHRCHPTAVTISTFSPKKIKFGPIWPCCGPVGWNYGHIYILNQGPPDFFWNLQTCVLKSKTNYSRSNDCHEEKNNLWVHTRMGHLLYLRFGTVHKIIFRCASISWIHIQSFPIKWATVTIGSRKCHH